MIATYAFADQPEAVAGTTQLIAAALIGIAVIVVLIAVTKLHPFLSLTIGSRSPAWAC